ncbi:MAG: hypothetical protein KAG37_02150, partial [Flavobacteriales bacterium]|nr:hypothetical protein [Flavobacteriales bacterium]
KSLMALLFMVLTTANVFAGDINIRLIDSNGDGLEGGTASYYDGGWKTAGTTDADGNVMLVTEKVPTSFRMIYNGMQKKIVQDIAKNRIVEFNTVSATFNVDKVDFHSRGETGESSVGKWYYNIGATNEFFPDCYTFKFDNGEKTKVCITESSNYTNLRLIDSEGNGLQGGIVGYLSSEDWLWHNAVGTTDENGNFTLVAENVPTTISMTYKGYKVSKDDANGFSSVEFQTVNVTGGLKDSKGNPLGSMMKVFSNTEAKWLNAGDQISDDFSIELLEGEYSFVFNYDFMTSEIILQDISKNTNVEFATVIAQFEPNTAVEYNTDGAWRTMDGNEEFGYAYEFIPGCYWFRFNGEAQQKVCITESGNSASVRFVDSKGNGIEGGIVGYLSSEDWIWHNDLGTTDENGNFTFVTENVPTTISMTYKGYKVSKDEANGFSSVEFQTVKVTGGLKDSKGNPLGSMMKVFSNTEAKWLNAGDQISDDFSIELLEGEYSFVFDYDFMTSEIILQDVSSADNRNVELATVLAQFEPNTAVEYNTDGAWRTMDGNEEFGYAYEFIPGCYWFRFDGEAQQKVCITESGDYGSAIVLTLLDENGNGVEGATAQPAYGGSWGDKLEGTTDADGKLYATNMSEDFTKIRMIVNQGKVTQSFIELEASNYTWYTQTATIKLIDNEGKGLFGGEVKQGGGFWDLQGSTDENGEVKIEMFPGSYKFKVTYNFTSQTITQNIDETIVFQTGKVIGETCTEFSAGSWRTFVNPMQLLPGTRDFKFTDEPTESYAVIAGKEINIPTVLPKLPYPSPFTGVVTVPVEVEEGCGFAIVITEMKFWNPFIVGSTSEEGHNYVDGAYQVELDLSSAPSGTYIYTITAKGYGPHGKKYYGQIIKN